MRPPPSSRLARCFFAFAFLALVTPATAQQTGVISGSLPATATAVTAVDRSEEKPKSYTGTVDAKTGKFTITGLPVGKDYDLIIDFGKVRLEGVNLKVPPSDFEEEMPLTDEDKKIIEKICRKLNKFENEIDVLTIVGNCQHAVALLNKRRTTPFYESKPGEMIYRLETWRFEKPEEIWVKSQEELAGIHYRERLQKADYEKKSLTLDARLGGIKLTADEPRAEVGKVTPPDGKPGIKLRDNKGKP